VPGDVLTLVGQNSYLFATAARRARQNLLSCSWRRSDSSGPFALAVLDCRRFMGAPLPLSPNHQIRSYLLMAKTRQPVRTLTVVDRPVRAINGEATAEIDSHSPRASVVMFGGGHARLGRDNRFSH